MEIPARVASCLTAGFLIFFFSAFSGEDLLKNHSAIKDLDRIMAEISDELNGGIERRTRQLGEAPPKNPYRKFYSAELAKEIHEISYLTEKQKIMSTHTMYGNSKTSPSDWFLIPKRPTWMA